MGRRKLWRKGVGSCSDIRCDTATRTEGTNMTCAPSHLMSITRHRIKSNERGHIHCAPPVLKLAGRWGFLVWTVYITA